MEIIKTQLEDILKFPFKEKDWINTFGIYIVISLVSVFTLSFFLLFLFFGGVIIIEALKAEVFTEAPFLITILFLILLGVFFMTSLYLQGYVVEMIKNIKEGKDEKPRHSQIKLKIKRGFDRLLLIIGPIAISFLILTLSLGAVIWGISLLETNTVLGIIFIIAGALKTLFSILLIVAVSVMVLPSMLYIYLQTNSVVKGYCFRNVWKIIKNMWKEFLVVYAVSILLAMIVSAIGQMPCIGFFAFTIGTAYTTFVIAFLTGRIFVQIDKLKLFQG